MSPNTPAPGTPRVECLTGTGHLRHVVGLNGTYTACNRKIAYVITAFGPAYDDMPQHGACFVEPPSASVVVPPAEDPMQDGGHVWLKAEPEGYDACRCGMFRFAYYAHGNASRRPCPLAPVPSAEQPTTDEPDSGDYVLMSCEGLASAMAGFRDAEKPPKPGKPVNVQVDDSVRHIKQVRLSGGEVWIDLEPLDAEPAGTPEVPEAAGPLDLAAIKARVEAATPGPWAAYDANEGTEYFPHWSVANDAFHNPTDDDEPWLAVEVDTGQRADAEFIAGAREDIPALVAAVERLTLALEAKTYVARKNNEHFMSVTAELEKRDFDLSTARAEIAELRRIGTPEWEAEQEDAQAEANTERPPDKEYYEHG